MNFLVVGEEARVTMDIGGSGSTASGTFVKIDWLGRINCMSGRSGRKSCTWSLCGFWGSNNDDGDAETPQERRTNMERNILGLARMGRNEIQNPISWSMKL